jgi:hypothetical protein
MCSKELIKFNKKTNKATTELTKLKVRLDKANAESNSKTSKKVTKKMSEVPVKLKNSKAGKKVRQCIDTAMERCSRKAK